MFYLNHPSIKSQLKALAEQTTMMMFQMNVCGMHDDLEGMLNERGISLAEDEE